MFSILLYSLLAAADPIRASSDSIEIRAPILGSRVVPTFWDAQAFPGETTLRLNGTVQEMRRQLLEINPLYDTDFPPTHEVRKRTSFGNAQLECRRDDWGQVEAKGYFEGIDYLHRHGGVPHMGPGPGACSRVSCSWKTGIWMCNDASYTLELDWSIDLLT